MAEQPQKATDTTTEAASPPTRNDNTSSTQAQAHTATVQDDSDPDFDDLDDVLDQFAANAPSKQTSSQTQVQSQPSSQPQQLPPAIPVPSGLSGSSNEPGLPLAPKPNESEDEFLGRLAAEMAAMLPAISDNSTRSGDGDAQAKMAAELEALTHKMEADGMKPEDLLKMMFGADEAAKLAEVAAQEAKTDVTAAAPTATSSSSSSVPKQPAGASTFEDTIRRTMSRLDQSNVEATNATTQSSSKSEDDLLAEMLKAFEAGQGGGGAGDEDGLSKMFLDMMQQLTHKDVLYEPMKELHDQYPTWLSSHRPPKLTQDEHDRYTRQSAIVAQIVSKFEEPGFSDDDSECREFIWERMQQMQGEGAPPEELVKNPFPGTDFGGIPGLGGGGGEADGPDEGCPTQ